MAGNDDVPTTISTAVPDFIDSSRKGQIDPALQFFRHRIPVDAGRFVKAAANPDNVFEPGRIDEIALDVVRGM